MTAVASSPAAFLATLARFEHTQLEAPVADSLSPTSTTAATGVVEDTSILRGRDKTDQREVQSLTEKGQATPRGQGEDGTEGEDKWEGEEEQAACLAFSRGRLEEQHAEMLRLQAQASTAHSANMAQWRELIRELNDVA